MKRVTITLQDDLAAALDRYREERGLPSGPADLSALTEAALRQYLRHHGYLWPSDYRPLRITPADVGSGFSDVSINHDRYLYEDSE